VGVGAFGRNHVRIYAELAAAGKVGIAALVDVSQTSSVGALAAQLGAPVFDSVAALLAARGNGSIQVDAASVCVPTVHHSSVSRELLSNGIPVLIEKPLAATLEEADDLLALAAASKCAVMVGHLERFNPAVTAVMPRLTRPMFFECHRLSVFTPRSLDVDVVLDLMIHDLDIVLRMAQSAVREVRAVGLRVLSKHADIANVRLEFESGCVANLTASRVSTEKVRKLRLFQPGEYLSLDYARQDAFRIQVAQQPDGSTGDPLAGLRFEKLEVQPGEPLKLEIEAFLGAVWTGERPVVAATEARDALALALQVRQAMAEHGRRAGLL